MRNVLINSFSVHCLFNTYQIPFMPRMCSITEFVVETFSRKAKLDMNVNVNNKLMNVDDLKNSTSGFFSIKFFEILHRNVKSLKIQNILY